MQEEFSHYVKKIIQEIMAERNIGENLDESDAHYVEIYNEIEKTLTDNGIKAYYEKRVEIITLIKKELLDLGMPLEEIDLFIETETKKNDARYRDGIKNFPEDLKKEFDKIFIEKEKEQLKLTMQDLFEYKASKILDYEVLKPLDIKQDVIEKKHGGEENYKFSDWFKLGVLFATGEMEKFYSINSKGQTILKNGYTPSKVAKELGNDSYNKLILATINNYSKDNSNGNKNIFNSRDKMLKIISHCEEQGKSVIPYFRKRLPKE